MKVGDIVKVVIGGEQVEVELHDTFEPDPSVGIFGEPGWLAVTKDDRDLFIACSGTVWQEQQEIGTMPELVEQAEAAAEREAEQADEWERARAEARYEQRYLG